MPKRTPLSVERNHKKEKLIHVFKLSDAEYYKIRMLYVSWFIIINDCR